MGLDISELTRIPGFRGACVVDSASGDVLAAEARAGVDLELESAICSEIVRANQLGAARDNPDAQVIDMSITTADSFHVVRPLSAQNSAYVVLILDRASANLGVARLQLRSFETSLKF